MVFFFFFFFLSIGQLYAFLEKCLFMSSAHFEIGVGGKEPVCQCKRHKRCGFDPWVRKTPWRRAWQPTPVFLPGESYGQKSLAGFSPQSHRESDTTEVTQHAHSILTPNCMSLLFILNSNHLPYILFANIVPLSEGCLFVLLTVIFLV